MLEPNEWFTEIVEDEGSAFSLKVTEKLHEEQTPYQLIQVYATTGFGNLMVIDGFVMLTSRENFLYHEMMSHPALFTHPNPRRVCIIGGGDCGTLREVLKHPGVASVVQIDIDEGVTRAAECFFPELTNANRDPRAQLLFADGIRWVQEAPAAGLDLIIVDSTDPVAQRWGSSAATSTRTAPGRSPPAASWSSRASHPCTTCRSSPICTPPCAAPASTPRAACSSPRPSTPPAG